MAKSVRLFSISDIRLAILKSNPPQLSVSVTGLATSTGWSNCELVPLEKVLSPDGILDLDFVGVPPSGISNPVLTPVIAHLVWPSDVDRLVGVKVYSRSGDVIHLLTEFTESAAAHLATTLAVSEEGVGPSTMAVGEEGPGPTTLVAGEEGPGPSTMAVGEEDPGPLTLAFGEGRHPTTWAIGEEGLPTTKRLGEEGPWTWPVENGPKTMMVGEEGPKWPRGEGPKGFVGETNPAVDDPKAPFGEETDWFDPNQFNPFGRR